MTSGAWGELNYQSRRERIVAARGKVEIQKRAEAARMVFAVRLPPPSKAFGWEIRRFGSFVLSRSETEYATSAAAKVAGEAAMAAGAGQS